MPDPIHGVSPPDALGVTSTAVAGSTQSASPPAQGLAGNQTDSADVAKAEALIATITEAANMVPPANLTRIAELRQAIESGTYQVNPQQVAKMIMEIEGLLASKGSVG
jgi:negative regulator of flagellin synthesis FlgM